MSDEEQQRTDGDVDEDMRMLAARALLAPPRGWPICPACAVRMRAFDMPDYSHGIPGFEGRNPDFDHPVGGFCVSVFGCPQCYLVQLYGRDKPTDEAVDAKARELSAAIDARAKEIEAEWAANPAEKERAADSVVGPLSALAWARLEAFDAIRTAMPSGPGAPRLLDGRTDEALAAIRSGKLDPNDPCAAISPAS
jgi:hypothetical protein